MFLSPEQLESDIKTAHSEVKDAKASHKRVEIELNTMQDEIVEAQVRVFAMFSGHAR